MEPKTIILERVIKLLNYSSREAFENDVKIIKNWASNQPHFPEVIDDRKIQNFLILNKGSLELAKQKIDNYYTVRSLLPEVFEGINPKLPYMQKFMNTWYIVASMHFTKDLYRVIYIKPRDKKLLETFNPIDGLRFLVNSQEVRLLDDVMFGDIFVVDGSNFTMSAMLSLTPTILYKAAVLIYEKVFSIRLKGVYFINFPSFLDKLLLILKTVLKPKLFDRVHVVQNLEVLFKELGKKVIPRDYGGEEKSLEELQEMAKEKFKQNAKDLDDLDQLRVNESLRPEELKNHEFLGFHGSFKKLEVD